MSDGYNEKSCNALEKSYYTPIEAALRWCGLIAHEVEIYEKTRNIGIPAIALFPQWGCLRANAEKIFEAMSNNELQHGRDGRKVNDGDYVAPDRRTVRHADLKDWMSKNYPDQKPKFLFDEVERTTHTAINADSFRALQADRDAQKVRVENALAWRERILPEHKKLQDENQALREAASELKATERDTLLLIIAALCTHVKIDPQARGMAKKIEGITDKNVHVSDDTIKAILDQIPEAISRRQPDIKK